MEDSTSVVQATHRTFSLRLKPHPFKRSQPALADNPAKAGFRLQGNGFSRVCQVQKPTWKVVYCYWLTVTLTPRRGGFWRETLRGARWVWISMPTWGTLSWTR